MVEFTAKVPGTYTIVDHSLGRLEKGAAAQIVIDGAPNPAVFQPLTTVFTSATGRLGYRRGADALEPGAQPPRLERPRAEANVAVRSDHCYARSGRTLQAMNVDIRPERELVQPWRIAVQQYVDARMREQLMQPEVFSRSAYHCVGRPLAGTGTCHRPAVVADM